MDLVNKDAKNKKWQPWGLASNFSTKRATKQPILRVKMDANPQGSHFNFWHPWTSLINDYFPPSV